MNSETLSSEQGFELLGIKQELVSALDELGIKEPTQIQSKAIPHIINGKDVIGISKTGSGKTAAFGVPLLQNADRNSGLQVLIISPTRELAVQITGELRKFSKYRRVFISAVYGGVSIEPQMENIARSQVVVGTPGRLKDHLQRGTIDFSKIKSVVLDEADKMVEMGFIEDIQTILDNTPKKRQLLLFGATLSGEIEGLKRKYMDNPVVAGTETKVEYLEQYYYNVPTQQKFSLLVHLLRKTEKSIVFCSSIRTVEAVARNLRDQSVRCEMIHGKLSQNKRLRTIEAFHKGYASILVASPVAARGLDIKDVTHVFNYDLSKDPQEYIHRVGRTARAGEKGKAITLLCERDYDAFRNILDKYRLDVQELGLEKFEMVPFRIERRQFGFRGNGFKGNGFHRNGFRGNGFRGGSGFRSNGFRGRR